jgi:hypothetical protein
MTVRGGVSPRWPHHIPISPTSLKSYRECPQRVRFQYIDNVPRPESFVLFFAKGNAAHLALQRIAYAIQRRDTPITDAQVMETARLYLPPQRFPSEDARLAEVRDVVRWVRAGRQYIERLVDPIWLVIERKLRREWNLFPHIGAYNVLAKPDVIVRHTDPDGEPVVKIIDYKTGKRWFDEMPALLTRLVARSILEKVLDNVDTKRIRFRYLWLDTGDEDIIDLTPEYVGFHWDTVFRDMQRLASESEWRPNPSFRCRYCPFFGNACTEKIPVDAWS